MASAIDLISPVIDPILLQPLSHQPSPAPVPAISEPVDGPGIVDVTLQGTWHSTNMQGRM